MLHSFVNDSAVNLNCFLPWLTTMAQCEHKPSSALSRSWFDQVGRNAPIFQAENVTNCSSPDPKGLSFHNFSFQPCMKFFLKHFALHALAHIPIPKSVWLSRGRTESTWVSQEKQNWYVQGYERTVHPTKYFSNDASGDTFQFPDHFCLKAAGTV